MFHPTTESELKAAAEDFVHRLELPGFEYLSAAEVRLGAPLTIAVILPTPLFQQKFGATYAEIKRPLHQRDFFNKPQFQQHFFAEREMETYFALAAHGDRSLHLALIDRESYEQMEAKTAEHMGAPNFDLLLAAPDQIPTTEEAAPEAPPRPLASAPARSVIEANLYRTMMGRNARLARLVDSNPTIADCLMKVALGVDNYSQQHRLKPGDIKLRFTKQSRFGEIVLKIDRIGHR